MAYRNSVAIVENFWNEVWKQPQTPDPIDRLMTQDFIVTSGGNDILLASRIKTLGQAVPGTGARLPVSCGRVVPEC